MKKKLEELILQAIESLKAEGVLDIETIPQITIDRTRDASHGDFASNLASLQNQALANQNQQNQIQESLLPELSRHYRPMMRLQK